MNWDNVPDTASCGEAWKYDLNEVAAARVQAKGAIARRQLTRLLLTPIVQLLDRLTHHPNAHSARHRKDPT